MKRRAILLLMLCSGLHLLLGRALGQGSEFVRITPETQDRDNIEVVILRAEGHDNKFKVLVTGAPDWMIAHLVVSQDTLLPEAQNFRSYFWRQRPLSEDMLLVAPLPHQPSFRSARAGHLEFLLDGTLLSRSYVYMDYRGPVADGGAYYCVDLSTYLQPRLRQMTIRYSPAQGLGPEKGVMRRDPSDIIRTRAFHYEGNYLKTENTYHVWYTKSHVAHGYDATVWYATSADGHTWVERGEAVPRGPEGSWDAQSVFTPNILKARDKYYLLYTGVPKPFNNQGNKVTKSAIGIAVAGSADGPWQKLPDNPILTCSNDPAQFDSMRVDDACLLVRGGKYWLYYKGRQWDNTPAHTMMGLAIAHDPEGPYEKLVGNPIIRGGHEVLVWPVGEGVVAMVNIGPAGIARTLQYAPDGLTFCRMEDLETVPSAPGAYRPEAFTDRDRGQMIEWGLHIGHREGFLPFLERFDCEWQ